MQNIFQSPNRIFIAGLAAATFAVAAPAQAHDNGHSISFNGLDFDDDADLLQQLIDLDADDIDEIREEFAEAQEEIAEAIEEVEDARAELQSKPGGGMIVRIAFSAASAVVSEVSDEIFQEVITRLDDAESELAANADEVGPEEVAETGEAINVIRTGLDDVANALEDLTAALKA